jgi:hypothetical protein
MGGFGSGRHGGRECTDDMRALDVRRLQRDDYLQDGMAYGWQWSRRGEVFASVQVRVQADRLILDYRQRQRGGEWQDMHYPVLLERTPCRYGGERVWWRCPAAGCGRRVALLFGGAVFACRHCHRLAYRSQREAPDDRATRRADKLRDRLGWEAGILNGEGCKPKGMHWRTYERLTASHDARVRQAVAGMAAKLGLAMGRLESINEAVDRMGL